MTSLRTSKTKLLPLQYPHKPPTGDEDVEAESHLMELYNDADSLPSISQTKEQSYVNKPLKSLKFGLYKDILSSEGVLSSDNDEVLADMTKSNFSNQGVVKNRVPLLLRKSGESKGFKSVTGNNNLKRASFTPSKNKITEHTHEEDTAIEHLETEHWVRNDYEDKENVVKEKISPEKKILKHFSEKKNKKNKENNQNNENNPMVFQSQQLDRKMLENISPKRTQTQNKVVKSPQQNNLKKQVMEKVEQNIEFEPKKEKKIPGLKERINTNASEQSLGTLHAPRYVRDEIQGVFGAPSNYNSQKLVGGGYDVPSNYHSQKLIGGRSVYNELLRELSLDMENLFMANRPQKASRDEKTAMEIVEKRLGKMHAERLFELFVRYCATKETHRKSMTLGKLLMFMKIFHMFEENITREDVNIIFAKRCPQKFADFASFVDILYKFHKISDFQSDIDVHEFEDDNQFSAKDLRFQRYLQVKIFDRQNQMRLNSEASLLRLNSVESDLYGLDREAMKVLEEYDEKLRKIFRSYWPWNNKYQGKTSDSRKGIVLLREYKQFCYDYHLIPSLFSLNQALEMFRKCHIEGEEAIDFKGFVHILCLAAQLEYPHGRVIHSHDSFAKKLAKLFSVIVDASHTVPERACR